MKRRTQGIYISLAIMLAVLINAVAIHILLEKKVQKQSQVESNLPTGDYLPDAECPLIRVESRQTDLVRLRTLKLRLLRRMV